MNESTIRLPERLFCHQHLLEVVPQEHPTGILWQTRYTVAGIELFKYAIEDERIIAKCHGDVAMIQAIISQHAPLCCFVSAEQLAAVGAEVEQTAWRIRDRLPYDNKET